MPPRFLLLLPLAAISCVSSAWDIEALGSRYPGLAAITQHRLADVNPYLLPANGEIAFFLCRWPDDEAIPVSLPPDATPEEQGALEAVMRAWEGAGLGVRFTTGAPPGVGIEVRFIDPEESAGQTVYAGNTVADCGVGADAFDPRSSRSVLRSRLVFASIHLWRGGFDNLGRPVAHTQVEFAGSALHEFGHALGFQGHPHVGQSIMVTEKDVIRRAGANLLKGRPFQDATLRALYAVPSGAVIQRSPVQAYQTRVVDGLQRLVRQRSLRGPRVRVGDIDGFLRWRDAEDKQYLVRIAKVKQLLRSPEKLWVEANFEISELLEAN